MGRRKKAPPLIAVSVYLTADDKRRLKRQAERTGRSIAAEIRHQLGYGDAATKQEVSQ